MVNKSIYILLPFFLLGLAACSNDTNDPVIPDGEKEEIVVYAGISTTAVEVNTKADPKELNKDFDLFYSFDYEESTPAFETYMDMKYKDGSYKTGLYWDNQAGGGATATMTMLGVYPQFGLKTLFESDKDNLKIIDWVIKTNQSADGAYEASDLHISDILPYTLAKQKKTGEEKVKLSFNHVMSKVTIRLIAGTGFLDDDGNFTDDFTPSISLMNIETKAKVNALTQAVALVADNREATFTPTSPEVRTNDDGEMVAKQVTAILIPGQEFAKGTKFAEVTMNGNRYDVMLESELKLTKGINHVLNVKIHKTEVGLQTTVTEWDDDTTPLDLEIKIGLEKSNAITDGVNAVNGALMFIQVDNQKNSYQHEYNSETTKSDWTPRSTIFWDDVDYKVSTGGIKAAGLLYNIDAGSNTYTAITENPEEIYIGESQNLIKANDTLRIGNMTHPFSKLNITVRSHTTEDDRVAIADIKKITLANSKKFKQVNTNPAVPATYMTIDYEANAEYTYSSITPVAKDSYNTFDMEAYIEPGKTFTAHATNPLDSDLLMTVQVVTGGIPNDYILRMPSGSVTFEKNHEYNIEVTLTKTSVALKISITPWQQGDTIGGGATIEY